MLNKKYGILVFIVIGLFLLALAVCVSGCPPDGPPDGTAQTRFPVTGWPIDAMTATHDVGNSAGEYQAYGQASRPYYFHGGLDILEDCAPNGPWVYVVREGTPTWTFYGQGSWYNGLKMVHDDGSFYEYWHLDWNSIDQDLRDAANGQQVYSPGYDYAANSTVARLVFWPAGDYHHLHFQIEDSSGKMDPILTLTPSTESYDPIIQDVFFAQNMADTEITAGSSGYPDLSGNIDIIVQCYDIMFGSEHTGVFELSYWVTDAIGTQVKSPVTVNFHDIPPDSDTLKMYRISGDFVSDCSYWNTENYYYVVTNVNESGDIVSDSSGYWDTTAHDNGVYKVYVKAEDASGNSVTHVEDVNISN
ncbi:hypothetical protein ACFLX3_05285 [Chloroflexota bacterium]